MEDKADTHTPSSPVTGATQQQHDKYGRLLFNENGYRKYDEEGRPILKRNGSPLPQDVIDQLPCGADDVVVGEFEISYKKVGGNRVIASRRKPGNSNVVLTDGCIAYITRAIDTKK
jgi:hypothetical protein